MMKLMVQRDELMELVVAALACGRLPAIWKREARRVLSGMAKQTSKQKGKRT